VPILPRAVGHPRTVSFLGALVVMVVLGTLLELFRAKTRRRLVEQYVADRGWTLKSCRYAFRPFSPNWLVPYSVEVVDQTGHELTGMAYATGFIRRRAWIDW
jgi:hypothetical protein